MNTGNISVDDRSMLSNLRYIFVVNTVGPFGGAERQALILADYLKTNVSRHVKFLALEDGQEFRQKLESKGIEIIVFPFKHHSGKLKKVFNYYRLIKLLKKEKPDVLIPYVAESNKVVAQIWSFSGARFAFWNQREEGRNLYGTSHEKNLINKVPSIVSNSFEGKNALIKAYGLTEGRITVINNGVIPYMGDIQKIDWHKKLGVDPGRPLVAMIANITERKDHDTLIRAWSEVIRSCRQAEEQLPFLILAGRKARTYDQLRLLAFDLKLSDHIAFTGSLKNVQELIEAMDFCVFSSNLEGCPNGVLECMERGKTVVGTHISGMEQALGLKYKKHVLVPPNDYKTFSDKVLGILRDPKLKQDIGDYNKKRISSEFSVQKMADTHLKLVEKGLRQ
ncbi:glycosyltransferase family 4 protein [Winogradskyella aurantiaca]|uniref:glycosyltransferase family 4 protein n=1 Tax=Winogradskyella aurantiaca TaxID=2219558 RepID=UPI0013008E96|nr:glycosyltransferase family 4 protein [Winogradskyella aurantiaca]